MYRGIKLMTPNLEVVLREEYYFTVSVQTRKFRNMTGDRWRSNFTDIGFSDKDSSVKSLKKEKWR